MQQKTYDSFLEDLIIKQRAKNYYSKHMNKNRCPKCWQKNVSSQWMEQVVRKGFPEVMIEIKQNRSTMVQIVSEKDLRNVNFDQRQDRRDLWDSVVTH